jgi:predicted CopG family antitoxin
MPKIHLDEDTIERLDSLRIDDESYDEVITELINIYEAEEMTLYRSGDG